MRQKRNSQCPPGISSFQSYQTSTKASNNILKPQTSQQIVSVFHQCIPHALSTSSNSYNIDNSDLWINKIWRRKLHLQSRNWSLKRVPLLKLLAAMVLSTTNLDSLSILDCCQTKPSYKRPPYVPWETISTQRPWHLRRRLKFQTSQDHPPTKSHNSQVRGNTRHTWPGDATHIPCQHLYVTFQRGSALHVTQSTCST